MSAQSSSCSTYLGVRIISEKMCPSPPHTHSHSHPTALSSFRTLETSAFFNGGKACQQKKHYIAYFNELQTWSEITPFCFHGEIQINPRLHTDTICYEQMLFVHF